MYAVEGVISTKDLCLNFLNRSIPFFPKADVPLKPGEQSFIRINVLFVHETSGLTIIKILELKTGYTNTIKVKFIKNTRFLDETNNSSQTCISSTDCYIIFFWY